MAKFIFALTFVVPVILLSLFTAIVVDLVWGLSILSILSYFTAKTQGKKPWKTVGEQPLFQEAKSIVRDRSDLGASCPLVMGKRQTHKKGALWIFKH